MRLALIQPASALAAGAAFKVPVILSGGADVSAVPMQVKYDPAKLSLTGVENGDFLGRDGQAVALTHSEDTPGVVTIHASRPPGSVSLSGAGTVCVLGFQAKGAGQSVITLSSPGGSGAQQHLQIQAGQIRVQVK